jgi:hypothetical protein
MAALETFCEDLGEEVVPYMGPLMEVLITTIQTNGATVQVQELALSAACSIAGAAGAAFTPYLSTLVPVLQVLQHTHTHTHTHTVHTHTHTHTHTQHTPHTQHTSTSTHLPPPPPRPGPVAEQGCTPSWG